jgi:prophage antirepressor-like protein
MQISKFQFSEKEIRVITKDGDLWFVAKDICEILEIQNTTDALSRLDDDERSRFNLGRQGETNIINESGLYSLVLGSKKPEAKTFKKWVTSEVLPAIRKTGQYSKNLSTFELIAQMAQASAELEKKIAVHDQKISQLENKVEKKFT